MATIGIDIGNVIIGGGGEDTSFFTDDFLETPMLDGAFSAIRDLVYVGHDVVLISKCGAKVAAKSMAWLQEHDFFEITGLDVDVVYFVEKRQEKAPLAESLGVSVMIDDRQDIIDSMQGIVELPILFTSWDETMKVLEENDYLDKV